MKIFRYFLFLLILPFISLLNVHADTKKINTIQFNESEWYINYGYWGSSMFTSGSVIDIYTTFNANDTAVNDTDNTVILDVCAGDGIIVKRTATVGNSCTNSCFSQNVSVQNLNRSCVLADNSSGFSYRIFLPVNKWDDRYVTSPNSHVYLQDKITISSKYYNSNFIVYGAYLTDELVAGTNDYSEINSQINALNSNINNTNSKLDDANSKLDEAENTRKGIWGTIKDVLSNIISLPKKIVEILVDALKGLFIPTESQISEVIDDSKELSENFGFVGEGVSFSVQLFTSLLNISQSNGCVEFPEFSLDFSNIDCIGHNVKFWDKKSVCLADNQWFGSNSNGIVVVRSISTILLIVVFLNFCYKAFFRVLSKESGD